MFNWLKNLFSKKGRSNVIMTTALTWEQAEAWMKLGKKVTHIEWPESKYLYIWKGVLHCNTDGYISCPDKKALLETYPGNPWSVLD